MNAEGSLTLYVEDQAGEIDVLVSREWMILDLQHPCRESIIGAICLISVMPGPHYLLIKPYHKPML